jgi:hypothetical protein
MNRDGKPDLVIVNFLLDFPPRMWMLCFTSSRKSEWGLSAKRSSIRGAIRSNKLEV